MINVNKKFSDIDSVLNERWIPSTLGFQVLMGDSMTTICTLPDMDDDRKQQDTAVLIAMAPDLLREVIRLRGIIYKLNSMALKNYLPD